jgi:hypothetical protein
LTGSRTLRTFAEGLKIDARRPSVEHEDIVVYCAPDGVHYVALIGEQWRRWPAVADGWLSKQGCPATLVDQCYELEPKLGDLALRLRGVTL